MLSRVKIQNFKSIGEPGVDLELKPLTFLVGPNGAGKSSILEGIAFAGAKGKSSESFSVSEIGNLHHRGFSPNGPKLEVELEILDPSSRKTRLFSVSHIYGGVPKESVTSPPNGSSGPEVNLNQSLFDKVFLLRATRGIIAEKRGPDEPTWVGAIGAHALEILDRLAHARHAQRRSAVQRWASAFGMSGAAVSLVNRSQIEGSFADDTLGAPLNLSLASSGSRQILPVILLVFWADANSVLMIEEPEMSLHPKGQVDVVEMFAEAIKEDKQIVATTHSLFMLQGIGYAVHKGWLEPDQVAVYHVEKKKGIGTVARRLVVKKTGYIKGWVPSFAKVESAMLREWSKTLPRE